MTLVLATFLMPECHLHCALHMSSLPTHGESTEYQALYAHATPVQAAKTVQQFLQRSKRAAPQDDRPT